MSVSIEQCQKQEKSRLAACRQSWIFLVFDRAKAREREGAKQLPACTAKLTEIGRKPESGKVRSSFPRGTAREEVALREKKCTAKAESRKVEKKKRKQVITCELEWDMMFIN